MSAKTATKTTAATKPAAEKTAKAAAKNYLTSPGGVTLHATLYSAVLREINAKGKDARFVKTERGKFAVKK